MEFIPITRGRDGAELKSQTYTFDRSRGHTYSEIWKALNTAKQIAHYNARVNYVQRAQMKLSDGMAECTYEWGGSEAGSAPPSSLAVTTDRWAVAEPNQQRDLFQHPWFIAEIDATTGTLEYTMDVISIIRRFASNSNNGSAASTEASMLDSINTYLSDRVLPEIDSTDAAYWMQFYRLYANGQTHYQDSNWVLRHTTNCPANWARNVADTNRNRIYTNGQFLSEVTNGTLWIYPLPTRLQFKLNNAVDAWIADHPARTGFANGWLKSASPEETVGGGRIEIQTSYWLNQWPTFVYPVA